MFVCCVHDGAIPVCLCAVYMMELYQYVCVLCT